MEIGPNAEYQSISFWRGQDFDGNYVEKGTYKIVGVSGYFKDNNYIRIETDPQFLEVTKSKSISNFGIFYWIFERFFPNISF